MNHLSLSSNEYDGRNLITQDMVWETIHNITELYRYDGDEFVRECYRNLYGREPDSHGMAYYLGRLALGFDKTDVIVQMSQSAEAKRAEDIAGLSVLLAQARREKSWFWGLCRARSRRTRQQVAQTNQLLAAQRDAALRASQSFAALQGTVQSIPWQLEAMSRNLEGVAQSINALREVVTNKFGDQPPHAAEYPLSEDEVRRGFFEVLGRAPEDDQVIEHHQRHYGTYGSLVSALMTSSEYQSKVSRHERIILNRLVAASSAHLQGA